MSKIQNLIEKIINSVLKISKKILPKKLYEFEEKLLQIEVVFYIIFGVLTTIVNIGVFSLLTYLCNVEENISNIIAILIAILFAYVTNKELVFHSTAKTTGEKAKEFFKFMLGRFFTILVEFFGFILLFNILSINKLVSKIIVTVIVIILNFFISKFFAFKKKEK